MAGGVLHRDAEMPGSHGVGEEVVVDVDVVLVGPDHIAQVCPPSPVDLGPVLPITGPVEGHLRPLLGEELHIVGPSQVVVDGIGDVGDDVLFDLAGPDPDPLSIGGLPQSGVTSSPVSADSQAKKAPAFP